MEENNNKIKAGFIILTDGGRASNTPAYRIAVNPKDITIIESHSGWSRCNAQVHTESHNISTIETFDEILQAIEDYNKQHQIKSNYDCQEISVSR